MKKQTSNRSIMMNKQGRLFKWRWWIFGLLGAFYISFELFEHPVSEVGISTFMVLEILLLLLPVGLSIYLFEGLLTAVAEKDQAVQLLDEKNRLIFQLAKARDWDSLITSIIKFPGTYTRVSHARLQIYDESSDAFQVEAVWTPEDEVELRPISFDPLMHCSSCYQESDYSQKGLRPCEYIAQQRNPSGEKGHCLPLVYGTKFIATLSFALPAGTMLDGQTEAILQASNYEIASALEAARERRARLASELANVARGERLLIARDLHDTLGQNLGYLHLKLDQLTHDESLQDVPQLKPELERLQLVADEAYELVRGALAFMHQDDDLRIKLCELIEIHSRMVANRSNLEFSLSCQGTSGMLPLQIVRQVFYAVKEAMHNVERHSGAQHITIALEWGMKDLTIHIIDDGVGFDQQAVQKDRHFGLEMMRERIETCKGRLSLESATGAGTHITMWLPTTCDEAQKLEAKPA